MTHAAGANQADADPIVGSQDSACQRPGRGEHANGGSSEGLVKISASYLCVGHFLYCLLFRFAGGRSGTCWWRPVTFSRFMGWRGEEKRIDTVGTEGKSAQRTQRRGRSTGPKTGHYTCGAAGLRKPALQARAGRVRKKKGVLVCTEDAPLGLRLGRAGKAIPEPG